MPIVKKGYSLTQIYDFYKEKCIENNEKVLDRKMHREICKEYNKAIIAEALEGRLMKLPFAMGTIWVKKFRIDWNKLMVDFNATKREGRTIYFTNEHSDNFNVRWAWSKLNKMTTNMIYYAFKPSKTNAKELCKILHSPGGHKRFYI